ncbi:MAG: YmdB family metallophosphoesterase [Spirochaetaceae bacterium]|jgi:metallophosphoesterase (TIGR00282 family)|nr:YmdB family metallophosphoesterase [Spirochaetaceae bacterium]
MRILYVAEIVGKAGIYALKKGIADFKRHKRPPGKTEKTGEAENTENTEAVDFVIACADGATGGTGLGRGHAVYLHKLGVNALTTGECCFYKRDLVDYIEKIPYLVRPANLNPWAPGVGYRIFKTEAGKIGVAVLLGQSGFSRFHGDNPFSALPVLVERLKQETPFVIVDFHAEATAEKRTLFAIADGRCSAVIGSHSRVQTADETVLAGGTAVITDAGRTGSFESVGGSDIDTRIQEYLTGIPNWTKDTWAKPELQGVILDLAEDGAARSITRVRHPVPPPPDYAEHPRSC